MGKRKNADSGVHPGEENQKHDKKRNRSSPSESDVSKRGEIMSDTSLKATNAENREHAMSSMHDSDPIREDEFATSSGTTGVVVPERTNKVCATLDGNLSVKGEIITKMGNNNREKGFMRKYSKRKGNNSCEQTPSKSLSAIRNLEIDSTSDSLNETHNNNKLMISVKQEDFIQNAADDNPEEMAGKIDSSLLENKSSLSVKTKYYRRKHKAKAISESHSSDSCPSLADSMVLDTSGNNNSDVSVSDSMKSPDEMAGGQSNNLQSGSKKSRMVSDVNSASYEGKNFKPWSRKKIIWREKTYSNSGSCRKIPSVPSDRALQCSAANRMSTSKVADPDVENQSNNEASLKRDQIILFEEEHISKSAGFGIAEKVEKPPEVDMKPNDAKKTKSRRRNRHRGRGKGKVSNLNAVVSPALSSNDGISAGNSTLLRTTDLDSSGGNNITEATMDNLVSIVEDCRSTIREGGLLVSDSSEVLPKLSMQINAADLSLETKPKKEANDHDLSEIDLSFHPAISSSRLETLEMDEMLERDKVDSSSGNSLKSHVISEGSCLIGGPNDTSQVRSSIHLKEDSSSCLDALNSKEAKKRENGKCSDCTIEQIPGDKPGQLLDCVGFSQADGSNMSTTSKVRSRKKEMKHAVEDSAELTGACLEKGVEFFHVINNSPVIDAGSVKQSLEVIPADCKDKASLPPSPIRGVIDDFTSSDLTNKQNGSLDLLSGEEGSFSFQIVSNAIKEKSHERNLEESFESTNKIACQNVKPSTHETSPSTSPSLCDSGVIVCLEEKVMSSPRDHFVEDVSSDVIENQDKNLEEKTFSPQRAVISSNRKKLLVLDLNGLLADITMDTHRMHRAHRRVGGKSLFKRPYCDDFLKFCFEKFNIGVWSSRKMYNVDIVVECLMRNTKDKLLFCWDQSKCTTTGLGTIGNVHKPLVLKELKKLWDKEEPELPWELGEYTPSNTLLIDDSPYKALLNPPYTGIFPPPYNSRDVKDNSLGPGGDLRVYLEGLAVIDDVQQYVCEHPFGQAAITDKHPDWSFYMQIIEKRPEPSGLGCDDQ
ncbi:Protein-serine/threonine phosphatase protein [Dioscorea alata]|uniref:Protein-serine/threonine phosphatase protein n=2 Tax=Dioscorea alata TaxID=55571 RepID=A0ACB7UJK4_DIOAL|nr:Protein-serine/threonine phosphatase protein [Dioscorea alata]KAH7660654.1 Protein-serine/threonine phosphatase protein [Dioscorea alata]